jgi:hypothetical protein
MNLLPLRELRFAVRRLRKDLGSTIASVALACAIGAAVATWSLVSAVLLKPLPIDTQRLFIVDSPPPPAVSRIGILKHVIAAGAVACNERSVKASVIGTPNRLHHPFAAPLQRVDTAGPGLPASPRAVSPAAR